RTVGSDMVWPANTGTADATRIVANRAARFMAGVPLALERPSAAAVPPIVASGPVGCRRLEKICRPHFRSGRGWRQGTWADRTNEPVAKQRDLRHVCGRHGSHDVEARIGGQNYVEWHHQTTGGNVGLDKARPAKGDPESLHRR